MIKRILILFYSINVIWAINAYPGLITVQQPDGSVIECYVKGDEWANWHETTDGYSIVKNDLEIWVYAVNVDGRFLIPGNKVVGEDFPPLNIDKHLSPTPEFRPIHQSNVNLNAARTDTFHVPVIYFQFPDMEIGRAHV